MNKIRAIQALNQKEIEQGISPDASWHTDYRDTAFVYFGGLPYELSEGDVITIFSQFGEPVFLKLARDKDTGKSKGFGWLKYEDQRSTDLAVDNLGGADIGGRVISVDHARYKARDDEDPADFKVAWEDMLRREGKAVSDDGESSAADEARPMFPAERELAALVRDHDDDDPMKGYLIEEKRKQVHEARRIADRRHRAHGRSHRDGSSRSHRRRGSDEGRHRRSRRHHTPDDGGGHRSPSRGAERRRRGADADAHDTDDPRRHRSPSPQGERRRRRTDDDDNDDDEHPRRHRRHRERSRDAREETRRHDRPSPGEEARHTRRRDGHGDDGRARRRRSRSRSPR